MRPFTFSRPSRSMRRTTTRGASNAVAPVSGVAPPLLIWQQDAHPFHKEPTVRTQRDPTNLDHVAYTIVGLGILGWILSLLLR